MMNILGFDTSQTACSVALLSNDRVYMQHVDAPRQQAQMLLKLVDGLLNEAGIAPTALDLIAFGCGPGSFTGIRLAASVAQGLALGVNAKVVPVSSLRCMAQAAYQGSGAENILVAVDARMDEVYWGAYMLDTKSGHVQGEDQLSQPSEVQASFGSSFCCVGNAWEVYPEEMASTQGAKRYSEVLPRADILVKLAQACDNPILPAEAVPQYLRDKIVYNSS